MKSTSSHLNNAAADVLRIVLHADIVEYFVYGVIIIDEAGLNQARK